MYELHENEQYFFDRPTLDTLAEAVVAGSPIPAACARRCWGRSWSGGAWPCARWTSTRASPTSRAFRRYDLYRPDWLGEAVRPDRLRPAVLSASRWSQLFTAIRLLSRYDYSSRCWSATWCGGRPTSWVPSPASACQPTGYRPGYQTVQAVARNAIEFFSNVSLDLPISQHIPVIE